MKVPTELPIAAGKAAIAAHARGLPRQPLVDALRVATQFRAIPPEEPIPHHASRFGGLPSLPHGVEWPRWEGFADDRHSELSCDAGPLSFLAQLNLADVPDPTGLLPESGWLLFFYDAVQQPWGYNPLDRGGARVIFVDVEDGAASQLAAVPAGLAPEHVFSSTRLTTEVRATLPRWDWSLDFGVKLEEPERDVYFDLAEKHVAGPRPHHRLFGWPMEVQNEMDLQCQLVTKGIYCGNGPEDYGSEEAARLASGRTDWLMLLQLDTDEDGPGWGWGVDGCLYFWIRRQDLAACRFDAVWCILQTT